jgi:hypothetical protein
MALALLVAVEPDEVGQLHEVHMTVRSPNQLPAEAMGALQATLPPNIEPGESLMLPFVLALQDVGTEEYGRHVVQVSINGGIVSHELHFWVLRPEELALPSLR